jgi:hypothetical protein
MSILGAWNRTLNHNVKYSTTKFGVYVLATKVPRLRKVSPTSLLLPTASDRKQHQETNCHLILFEIHLRM